jgi:hypothetical protein
MRIVLGSWFGCLTRSPFRIGLGIWSWGGWLKLGNNLLVFGPRADEEDAIEALYQALSDHLREQIAS